MNIALGITYLVLFILSFVSIGKMLFHFWHMNKNVIGKYSGFFGMFILGAPNQFNQEGNRHRQKFLMYIPVTIILFLTVFFLSSYLGISK